MRIFREFVKWCFFALCAPARRLRNQRNLLRAEHDALCAEVQRLEDNVAKAKLMISERLPRMRQGEIA